MGDARCPLRERNGSESENKLGKLGLKDDVGPYGHLSIHELLKGAQGSAKEVTVGEGATAQNRYARLWRTIVRRNAKTVAQWQLYGFVNGVLNTDNTSIIGLSLDFGPFAFMDVYDPSFSPNHDDHALRYSYGNQPGVIWWNLIRLAEGMGELIGIGGGVDDDQFVNEGLRKEQIDEVQERASRVINDARFEYMAVVRAEFCQGLCNRLGLKEFKDTDFAELYDPFLDALKDGELDFNHAFRRLGAVKMAELETEESRLDKAEFFFSKYTDNLIDPDGARKKMAAFLEKYRARVMQDWGEGKDEDRKKVMDAVNPKVCRVCMTGSRLTKYSLSQEVGYWKSSLSGLTRTTMAPH